MGHLQTNMKALYMDKHSSLLVFLPSKFLQKMFDDFDNRILEQGGEAEHQGSAEAAPQEPEEGQPERGSCPRHGGSD